MPGAARLAIASLLSIVLLVRVAPTASASATPLPYSIAAAGDSMTTAFDVAWCCALDNSPGASWSTGDGGQVNSQYQHLLALNPAIRGHATNLAQFGARMAQLDGQVKQAAALNVDYLTVLIGANDICGPVASQPTSVIDFQNQYARALSDFFTADPHALVFVASIPNLYQLWQTLHGNHYASLAWQSFNICPALLATATTDALRQQALSQEEDYNAILQSLCSTYANCRFDQLAVFDNQFGATDASEVDYFHPSIAGQNKLAAVTWQASFWDDGAPQLAPFPSNGDVQQLVRQID